MQKQFTYFSKKKIYQFVYFSIVVTILLISCNDTAKDGVFISTPKDTSLLAKQNHFIPLNQIRAYQASFKSERDSLTKLYPGLSIPLSESFNKQAIIKLLQLPDCVGVTVLYGTNKNGNNKGLRLILVGVNSEGKYLYLKNDTEKNTATNQATSNDTAAKNLKMLQSLPDDEEGGIEHGNCSPPCEY